MTITSKERLHHLYFHEEMDRPAAIIRWWGFRDDPTYRELYRLMIQEADWVEPWTASSVVKPSGEFQPKQEAKPDAFQYQLQDMEDAEKYLNLPVPEINGDLSSYFKLKEQVGDRGIVLAHLGNNPGGAAVELFGSEQFALMSVTDREILHRLMQRHQTFIFRLIDYLLENGVGPYFSICGQEMIAPPLHGREDFFDFNVRYDKAIAERIHDAGGKLNVHCHGRLKAVLDGFLEIGTDVLHCFEAPPMGDITPADAKQVCKGRISLEGNIQIADFYEKSPGDIRRQTEALIRDCFADRRGLAVTPTASPFMKGRGAECYPQYQAMIDAVKEFSP